MNLPPDLSRPLLAIDTSTPAASAALRCEGRILADCHQGHAKHTEVLLPMIDRLLGEAELGIADLGGIIISAGPGAFTGLRVGASMAAGLAAAYQTPLACLSSLALLAAAAPAGKVLALMDARMQQHYGGFYAVDGEGVWALAADGLFDGAALPAGWLAQADNILACGEIYSQAAREHAGLHKTLPQARHAFAALKLAKWQSPLEAVDLQYLRNDITG